MAWIEHFIPLNPDDPRNDDRHNPSGDRIRVRLNVVRGDLVDFVVQFETPYTWNGQTHAIVVRSDGTHEAHYDYFDRFGNKTTVMITPPGSAKETVSWTVADIKHRWRETRVAFYRGRR